MTTKANKAERAEALARLREWLKPGDTVYTILRHVSRSGVSRTIDCVGVEPSTEPSADARGVRIWAYGWNVAKALGMPFDLDREGVRVSGYGMDMGFHVVYTMASAMYPEGFGCIGAGCPSNDHNNGDRDYTPHGGIQSGPECKTQPCTCHDLTAWDDADSYANGCGSCGCRRATHWHRDGGYALWQKWL